LDLGPDANTLGTVSTGVGADFAIKQAYVALRAPVGNGLDFKVGVFDSIIGYEPTEAVNNPNFTRSWGHTFEPSTHTGILATYRVNKLVAFSAGIANTLSPAINSRTTAGQAVNPPFAFGAKNESSKTYMGSLALTAPDDWGFIAGSTLYSGVVVGFNTGFGLPQQSYYFGATVNTPVTNLKLGAAFDYARTGKSLANVGAIGTFGAHSFAAYASYKASEKITIHGRAEFADISATAASTAQGVGLGLPSSVMSYTGTLQYDLWKNVLSRLEIRWDHALDGTHAFGGTQAPRLESGHLTTGTAQNAFVVAANVIYKF